MTLARSGESLEFYVVNFVWHFNPYSYKINRNVSGLTVRISGRASGTDRNIRNLLNALR